MPTLKPGEQPLTAKQIAAKRKTALAALVAAGMRATTPASVQDEMVKAVDPDNIDASVRELRETRWPQYFGEPPRPGVRSADKLAARALGKTS